MRWQKLAHATEFNPLIPIIIIPRFLLHGAVYGLQVQAIRVSLHGGGGGGGGGGGINDTQELLHVRQLLIPPPPPSYNFCPS